MYSDELLIKIFPTLTFNYLPTSNTCKILGQVNGACEGCILHDAPINKCNALKPKFDSTITDLFTRYPELTI